MTGRHIQEDCLVKDAGKAFVHAFPIGGFYGKASAGRGIGFLCIPQFPACLYTNSSGKGDV